MATLAITFTASAGDTGYLLRRLAHQIEQASRDIPDRLTTGADTVLTIDNGPSAGVASVQITAGPIQSSKLFV